MRREIRRAIATQPSPEKADHGRAARGLWRTLGVLPASAIRLRSPAHPSLEPTCSGLRPAHAAELERWPIATFVSHCHTWSPRALGRSTLPWLLAAALGVTAGTADARRRGAVRSESINLVVIHSTGGPTCDARTGKPIWVGGGILQENLRQIEAHPVLGIHYMIDRDGTVRSSVPEDRVAHHVYRLSARSIAIELVNDGNGVDPFPEEQLAALVVLLKGIEQRHGIGRGAVRRHSDLDLGRLACDRAQRRKVDPGSAFPYEAVLDRVYRAR